MGSINLFCNIFVIFQHRPWVIIIFHFVGRYGCSSSITMLRNCNISWVALYIYIICSVRISFKNKWSSIWTFLSHFPRNFTSWPRDWVVVFRVKVVNTEFTSSVEARLCYSPSAVALSKPQFTDYDKDKKWYTLNFFCFTQCWVGATPWVVAGDSGARDMWNLWECARRL